MSGESAPLPPPDDASSRRVPPPPGRPRSSRLNKEVLRGIGLGLAVGAVVQLVMWPLTDGMSFFFIAVWQFAYMVPLAVGAYLKKRPHVLLGLILLAALTFLGNAGCFGVSLYLYANP